MNKPIDLTSSLYKLDIDINNKSDVSLVHIKYRLKNLVARDLVDILVHDLDNILKFELADV